MIGYKEEILIKRLKNSDQHVLKTLFEYFYKPLCRFAYIMLQCKESAEDVVQHTFIQLWENRGKIEINNNLKSYLYITVKNNSINYLKSAKTRKLYETEYHNNHHDKMENGIDLNKFSHKLKEALQLLPEQCRVIYTLKNLEGLTYKEISEYLNISEKTVENQLSIALKKLRDMLIKTREELYS